MSTIIARWPPEHLGQRMGEGMPIFNRWHRLAAGCIGAWLPAAFPGGIVPNLATPGVCDFTSRLGTANNMLMTPDGLGVAFSGTAGTDQLGGPTPATTGWRYTTGQSLFVRGQKTATATNNTPTVLVGVNGTSSPFNVFSIGFGGTGAGGGGAITVYQTTVSAAQTGSIVPTLHAMFDAGANFPPGSSFGNGPGLWVNGVRDVVASPATVNITYPGTINTYLGGSFNSGRNVCATLTTGYIWSNRLLADQDFRYLHTNPYCLYLWPSDLQMAQIVGHPFVSPPIIPTSKSMIVAPLTIAGGALEWLGRRKMKMRRLRGE